MFIQDRIRISLTNKCNMSCYYCHNEGQPHCSEEEFISLDFIDKLVNFINKNNITINKVNITGGEPVLHKDLILITKKLSSICNNVKLNTNGLLLNQELLERLKIAGLTAVNIGVDNLWKDESKPNLYSINSNIKTNKLIELITFAKSQFKVSINTVVTYYNYRKIDNLINFSIENDLYKIKLIKLIDFDFRKNNITNCENSHYFDILLEKYKKRCKEIIYRKELGRYDLYLENGFMIRFGEDFCKTRACGNLYSIFNSRGDYVICQKSNSAVKIDFDKDFESIRNQINECNDSICNNKKNQFPRDSNGVLLI